MCHVAKKKLLLSWYQGRAFVLSPNCELRHIVARVDRGTFKRKFDILNLIMG